MTTDQPQTTTEPAESAVPQAAVEPTEPEPLVQPGEPTVAPAEPTAAQTPPSPVPDGGTVDEPPAQPRKDRRVLRAVLRWTAAVTVFAAAGVGTAFGITGMERTDVPGLATESDGRWVYPEITRPPLPSGSPGPVEDKNWSGTHYGDLREFVLPLPEGATEDKALRGTDGWLAQKDFLTVFAEEEDRDEVGHLLTDYGLRHTAARGWTTPDGTHTGVYLFQFDTGTAAEELYGELTEYEGPVFALSGTEDTTFDDGYPSGASIEGITRSVYDEVKPYGAEHVRQAYVQAGDVVALVVQSRKGGAAAVPFQQTVVLQSQLLG